MKFYTLIQKVQDEDIIGPRAGSFRNYWKFESDELTDLITGSEKFLSIAEILNTDWVVWRFVSSNPPPSEGFFVFYKGKYYAEVV